MLADILRRLQQPASYSSYLRLRGPAISRRLLREKTAPDSVARYLRQRFPDVPVELCAGQLADLYRTVDHQQYPTVDTIDALISREHERIAAVFDNAEHAFKKVEGRIPSSMILGMSIALNDEKTLEGDYDQRIRDEVKRQLNKGWPAA
jgi:hypothetical protein